MKTNRFFMEAALRTVRMSVILLSFFASLSACSKAEAQSSGGKAGGSAPAASVNESKIPSELLGGWWYQSDTEKTGKPVLDFTADGKCTSGIQWFAISVSGNTITYDSFGQGTQTGTFDYRVTNGELSITGATLGGFFSVFKAALVRK